MTELLKQAIGEVENLPPNQQDEIAELLQLELEEREWDALVASPASRRFLERLVAEARAEDAAGKTRDLDECWEGR